VEEGREEKGKTRKKRRMRPDYQTKGLGGEKKDSSRGTGLVFLRRARWKKSRKVTVLRREWDRREGVECKGEGTGG